MASPLLETKLHVPRRRRGLVLDDYHVIDAREVQDGMAFCWNTFPHKYTW